MKTKILGDFEICICVSLKQLRQGNNFSDAHEGKNGFPSGKASATAECRGEIRRLHTPTFSNFYQTHEHTYIHE